MNGLDVEGLLNFSIRSSDEVCCDYGEQQIVAWTQVHGGGGGLFVKARRCSKKRGFVKREGFVFVAKLI